MNEIKRYRPNFCEGFEPESQEFETQEEMLRIPWVKSWSKDKGFITYAKSCKNPQQSLLMAVLENPTERWVVGFIKDASVLDFPDIKDFMNKPDNQRINQC